MIRPRDAVAAILAQCFRATVPAERGPMKRVHRESLYIADRYARERGDAPTAAATIAALRAQELAQELPAGVDRAAVLCAVVRELVVDGDGILCTFDEAACDAGALHPLDHGAQHHVDAIVRECLAAVEPEARPAEVAA